jgi:hypothetical protein
VNPLVQICQKVLNLDLEILAFPACQNLYAGTLGSRFERIFPNSVLLFRLVLREFSTSATPWNNKCIENIELQFTSKNNCGVGKVFSKPRPSDLKGNTCKSD